MFRLLTFPLRLLYRVGRRVGAAALTVFALGVFTGLLGAREPGRDLRDRIRRVWEERGAGGTDLEVARRVRAAVSQSPRTWHLPQPEVEVVSGRAVLSGFVPHESGRAEIERVVATVAGVIDVESHLVVGEPDVR